MAQGSLSKRNGLGFVQGSSNAKPENCEISSWLGGKLGSSLLPLCLFSLLRRIGGLGLGDQVFRAWWFWGVSSHLLPRRLTTSKACLPGLNGLGFIGPTATRKPQPKAPAVPKIPKPQTLNSETPCTP